MAVRNYTMSFTTVGPVHIGSGEDLGKKDYFSISKNKIAVLDVHEFVSKLDSLQLEGYCGFLETDSRKGLQDLLDEAPSFKRAAQASIAYELNSRLARARRGSYQYFSVQKCIKDVYGKPYVPGSSVKGMLRTALMCTLILEDRVSFLDDYVDPTRRGRTSRADSAMQKRAFWRDVFYDHDGRQQSNDIMHYVSVSDSAPLSVDDLVFVKKYDKFSKRDDGSHKHDMGNRSDKAYRKGNELPIYRECIKPGTTITCTLSIDDRIDGFLPFGALDADCLSKVLEQSFDLYKRCFLDMYEDDSKSGGTGNRDADDDFCNYVVQSGPMAGRRCRNHAIGGTGYCGLHQDAAKGQEVSQQITCYLGGGADFDSKTVLNALFDDDAKRIDAISHTLFEQFPTKVDKSKRPSLWQEVEEASFKPREMRAVFDGKGKLKKAKDDHRHWKDPFLGVSPHTMKFGMIGDEKYPMGKCSIVIQER